MNNVVQQLVVTMAKFVFQCGICFDIDGVLVRGLVPLPEAVEAFRLLQHPNGQMKVPTVFLTNGFSLNIKKAKWLAECLNIPVSFNSFFHIIHCFNGYQVSCLLVL
jgi:ribonucleotide monophosphatase NagD (HAD superfamily)